MRPRRRISAEDVEEITLTCTAQRTSRCAGTWTGPKREAKRFFRYKENEPDVPVECWRCVYAGAPVSKGNAETEKEVAVERRRRYLATR
jgi:hypothetical protein